MANAEQPLVRVGLKLPNELKERARESARTNRRSLNREVQVALERHLELARAREDDR